MSAVEKFRSRVVQSATAAAIAARQLSALDEMAQNDEYVQSEGLNVSVSKQSSRVSSAASSVAEDQDKISPPSSLEHLSDKFVGAISSAARGKRTPVPEIERQRVPDGTSTVPRTKQQQPQQPKLVSSVANLYEKKNESTLHNSSMLCKGKIGATSNSESICNNKKSEESTEKTSTPQIVPKAPNTQSRILLVHEKHAHIFHQLDYDSDNSSSDDEESGGRDLETGDVEKRSSIALHDELERELEQRIAYQKSQIDETDGTVKKDPHRFMKMTADLESEREVLLKSLESISAHTNGAEIIANQSPSTRDSSMQMEQNSLFRVSAGDRSNEALKAGLSWVKNVASPQLKAFSRQIISKVEENANKATAVINNDLNKREEKPRGPMIGPRHSETPVKKDYSEDEIIVTNSASFLADADRAELERIQNMHSSPPMLTFVQTCLESLRRDPRLAFIAATLILALLVYCYSKKRSVDDVL